MASSTTRSCSHPVKSYSRLASSGGRLPSDLVLVVVPGPACVCDELSRIWDRFRPVFLEIRLQIGSATSAGKPIRSLVIRMARLPSLSVRARALA
ncbi:MAG: hypothetical protein ACI9VS_003217 [Candidatus Binatia bacterium]|jgi:hypothetical protein